MCDEIELPPLVVRTGKSQFRLRCHAAAWADEYGGSVRIHRRHSRDYPGLLLLSATGPDTAAKAVRATLYQPDVQAEFVLHFVGNTERLVRAHGNFNGKPAGYTAAIARLAPGVVHLVALAQIPGLMPNLSDDHLWTELSGPELYDAALAVVGSLDQGNHVSSEGHRRRQRLFGGCRRVEGQSRNPG